MEACSAGRPCDYTGLSYAKLRGAGGIQWPCTDRAPGRHRTALRRRRSSGPHPDDCETYGKDLDHRRAGGGDRVPRDEPRRQGDDQGRRIRAAARDAGRRLPVPADHRPHHLPLPHPHQDRPRPAAAGGRAARCGSRSPSADAAAARARRGRPRRRSDPARQSSRAGSAIGGIRAGVVFLPFHYGYWDTDRRRPGDGPRPRGQRADPHRLGPGVQAAAVQDRRRRAAPGRCRAAPVAEPVPATVDEEVVR